VQVTLNDGSSFIGYATAASDFIGFYSTDAAISSLTITKLGNTPGGIFPTVDNLYFAVVPAPGALALLGVAGIVGRRSRR
jgi:MYXO-CTERM domain-containing protein